MGWTKQNLVEHAFSEIGLSSSVFNVSQTNMQAALRSLDAMIGTWNGKGIRLGYPLPSSPGGSNLNDESGIPDSAFEAVYLNLALRIAPSVGKQASQDTRTNARNAYEILLSRAAYPPSQQFPSTLPLGAGNKPWRSPDRQFVTAPVDPLTASQGGDPIEFD